MVSHIDYALTKIHIPYIPIRYQDNQNPGFRQICIHGRDLDPQIPGIACGWGHHRGPCALHVFRTSSEFLTSRKTRGGQLETLGFGRRPGFGGSSRSEVISCKPSKDRRISKLIFKSDMADGRNEGRVWDEQRRINYARRTVGGESGIRAAHVSDCDCDFPSASSLPSASLPHTCPHSPRLFIVTARQSARIRSQKRGLRVGSFPGGVGRYSFWCMFFPFKAVFDTLLEPGERASYIVHVDVWTAQMAVTITDGRPLSQFNPMWTSIGPLNVARLLVL